MSNFQTPVQLRIKALAQAAALYNNPQNQWGGAETRSQADAAASGSAAPKKRKLSRKDELRQKNKKKREEQVQDQQGQDQQGQDQQGQDQDEPDTAVEDIGQEAGAEAGAEPEPAEAEPGAAAEAEDGTEADAAEDDLPVRPSAARPGRARNPDPHSQSQSFDVFNPGEIVAGNDVVDIRMKKVGQLRHDRWHLMDWLGLFSIHLKKDVDIPSMFSLYGILKTSLIAVFNRLKQNVPMADRKQLLLNACITSQLISHGLNTVSQKARQVYSL